MLNNLNQSILISYELPASILEGYALLEFEHAVSARIEEAALRIQKTSADRLSKP
jgi:hypothetical protein